MTSTTLVLNAGSSSVKFAVAKNKVIIVRGSAEYFGRQARIHFYTKRHHDDRIASVTNLRLALTVIQRYLSESGIVPTIIAHRIVHGGQRFSAPTRLTPGTIHFLRTLTELAPLHQPSNLLGVDFSKRVWPKAAQWGVFDTAIYRHLPAHVRTYALPLRLAERLHIQKYGFHGTSHGWAFSQALKKLRLPAKKVSAVTIHLGSGASMTLWAGGRPIDTTMGFTPLEGLIMSTRSGDIDPAIPLYIQKKLGWSGTRVNTMLERQSGLVGISGLRDMRDILAAAGHPIAGWPKQKWTPTARAKARLALDIFSYHIRRTLSGYLGLLDHPRAVIFTGPVGENRVIQKILLEKLPAAKGIRSMAVHADEEQAIVDAIST